MKIKKRMLLALLALAALAIPATASAHVSVAPEEAPSEGYAMLTFTVPHGCDAAATNRVEIQMPPQVISATPGVVPGWEISTTEGKLPRPSEMNGEKVTEGVRVVTWKGGPLPDGQLQQFPLSVAFAGEQGEKAEFKVLQGCVNGEETAWIQSTPASGEEPEHPAPAVELGESEEHGQAAHEEEGSEATSASEGDDSDSGNGLSIVALIVGALGLIVGSTALARGRSK